ncbi:hypothetical protein LP316_03350 [Thalassotalea sp. LPB0316]|uniref:hypothetical protein n=1 Tax=Thalassotalea sp. LPB0316 TaxID=2769490 RepID=UPI0018685CC2|nr:hypothetical protein [Thalassotalea sp. LPB0316]QOL26355.1 hypothetical protein LP316_03350 [Thalassotalea sp. LPB0316]
MRLAKLYSGMAAAYLLIQANATADIILLEDFEDDITTYQSSSSDALLDLANNDYYGRLNSVNLPTGIAYQNHQGAGFYGVQDTDSALANAQDEVTLEWQNIDISAWQNLSLTWFIAEDDASDGNEDIDATTAFTIATQVDKSGYLPLFSVRSAGGTNNHARVDNDFDGIGEGQLITDTFALFSRQVALGSVLDIQVSFANFDAGDEDFAFDQLMLSGDKKAAAMPVPEPSSQLLMAVALLLGVNRWHGHKRKSFDRK